MKLSLHRKQDDCERKRPLSMRFAINVKNGGTTLLFKITQTQSVSILSIFVRPYASPSFCCIFFMILNSFKWLLQCLILLFGHFGCREIAHLRDIAPLNGGLADSQDHLNLNNSNNKNLLLQLNIFSISQA